MLAAAISTVPAIATAQAVEAQAVEAQAVETPVVELRPVPVRFRSNLDRVAIHYLPDPVLDDDPSGGLEIRIPIEARYSELCTAPCGRDLPQTHLGIAFSRGGYFLRQPAPLGLDGPTDVSILWQDRADDRLAGLLTLSIGVPLGVILAVVGAAAEVASLGFADVGTIATASTGAGVLGASLAVGLYFVLREDEASFTLTPLPADASTLYSDEWR